MLLSGDGRDVLKSRKISDEHAIALDSGYMVYDDESDESYFDSDDEIYDREYHPNRRENTWRKTGGQQYYDLVDDEIIARDNGDNDDRDKGDKNNDKDNDNDSDRTVNIRNVSIVILVISIIFFLTAAALALWTTDVSDDVKNSLQSSKVDADISDISCDNALIPGIFLIGTSMNSSTASVLLSDSFTQLRLVDQSITSPSEPVWLSAEQTFWLVDKTNNRISVYDALTRALLEIIFTELYDCDEPFSPSYNAESGQVWVSCSSSLNFIVLDAGTRSLIGQVDMPSALQATHFMGPIVVGQERTVVAYNPDTLAVYDNTVMPPTLVAQKSITSAEAYTVMWRGSEDDDDALFVFSSTTETIYRMTWRVWNVEASVAVNSQVIDMTTDPENERLYVAVSPRHLHTYDARTLEELPDGSAGVSDADVTAVAVDVTGSYVTVGNDRGIAQKFDIKDNGAPDFTGSVQTSLVNSNYNAIGGITRATFGCPCRSCIKE